MAFQKYFFYGFLNQFITFHRGSFLTASFYFLVLHVCTAETRSITGPLKENSPGTSDFQAPVADTLPAGKETYSIRKKTEDTDIFLQMENGEISHLEFNGKTIQKEDYAAYQQYIDDVIPGKAPETGQGFWFDFDSDINEEMQRGMFSNLDSLLKEFRFDENLFSFGMEGNPLQISGSISLDSLFKNIQLYPLDLEEKFFPQPEAGQYFEDSDAEESEITDHRSTVENETTRFDVVLGNALNKDGLLVAGEENKVELTYSGLKINDKKQSDHIFQKYKRLFEESSGTNLQKSSKIRFTFTGKESARKFRVY
jgi:hypothetical protein